MTLRAFAHRMVPYVMVAAVGFGLGYVVVWLFVLPAGTPPFRTAVRVEDTAGKIHLTPRTGTESAGQGAAANPTDTTNLSGGVGAAPQMPEVPVVIPDLVGMAYTDAKPVLESLRLQVVVQQDTNSLQPENTVLRESPVSGTQVASGSTIIIVVSRFPPPNGGGAGRTAGQDSAPRDSAAAEPH